MKRRDFSLQLAGLGLGLTSAGASIAQPVPVEGQQYQKLSTPVPPVATLPAGKKIEVVEFFSYACPHCFAFEGVLEGWLKNLPPDVVFRPIPVGFVMGRTWVPKVFYALEEMGQREAMHRPLFNAIHVQRQPLATEAEAVKFLTSAGVDAAKLADALKSFAVNTKVNRATTLMGSYKVNSVPALGVNGRYTAEGSLPVLEYLIQTARKSA